MQADFQNNIKEIAQIFRALSEDPNIADELVESIAAMMYESQADSIMDSLEDSIEMSTEVADALVGVHVGVTAIGAHLDDGAFIALQDSLSYLDDERDEAIASLIEYGVEHEIAKKFHFQVLAHCISYLNHSQDTKYRTGEEAEKIWEDIQAESEENDDTEIYFNRSAIASATAKQLMGIFQELLNSKGGILTYQVLVNYVADLVDDPE